MNCLLLTIALLCVIGSTSASGRHASASRNSTLPSLVVRLPPVIQYSTRRGYSNSVRLRLLPHAIAEVDHWLLGSENAAIIRLIATDARATWVSLLFKERASIVSL